MAATAPSSPADSEVVLAGLELSRNLTLQSTVVGTLGVVAALYRGTPADRRPPGSAPFRPASAGGTTR